MKTKRFLLTAGIVLATAFTLSCSDDSGNSNVGICGGKEYDITVYSCERGELVGSCRGVSYYPAYEYCENGVVKDGAEISSSSSSLGGQGGGSSSSGGGSNFSDLPKQVYLADYDDDYNLIVQGRYEGNSDLFATNFHGEMDQRDTLPAGKIQNGQISLNLPDNVGKYLRKYEPCREADEKYSCQSTFSVSESLAYVQLYFLYVSDINISNKSPCRIGLYLIKSDEAMLATFYYLSEAGKINGSITETFENETYSKNYDWNYSKGWNILYRYDVNGDRGDNPVNVDKSDYNYSYSYSSNYTNDYTSDLSKAGGTLEWRLTCGIDN